MYILGVFALSSIGLIIASRITSEEFASGLINLLTYPMMFLSEIWFTLEGSGDWVKSAAKFSPLWHMTNGMRQIMNEGKTLTDLYSSVIILILISFIFTVIGLLSFRWTRDV
jgi:ABC-2 type transport system permease protein